MDVEDRFFFIYSLVTPYRGTNFTFTLQARWSPNGITVYGNTTVGSTLNQLHWPQGLYIDDGQKLYVADLGNHRIVSRSLFAHDHHVVTNENEKEDQLTELKSPGDVIIDRENGGLIICDESNKRVIRRPNHDRSQGEILLSDIACRGLTMDSQGYLYTSNTKKHEVRRWRPGRGPGKKVAGRGGSGKGFDQLDFPTFLFVDSDCSIYVSDKDNHRVMKWTAGAKKGELVAGNQKEGDSAEQLYHPEGIVVDNMGTIYVADYGNNRIMRWPRGATQGSVVVGGNGVGSEANRLNGPIGLAFDFHGHLYVADASNNRVQKFELLSP